MVLGRSLYLRWSPTTIARALSRCAGLGVSLEELDLETERFVEGCAALIDVVVAAFAAVELCAWGSFGYE
jgi:hypothetical protein